MSNWLHAYGWMGHILCSQSDGSSAPEHNVVAIPEEAFARLVADFDSGRIDRFEVEKLGVEDGDTCFLAAGYAFSAGFRFYGTIFAEAEMLEGGNEAVSRARQEAPYLAAFKEIYGVELPPCKLMIGACREHL